MENEPIEERYSFDYYLNDKYSISLDFSCRNVTYCKDFAEMCKAFAGSLKFPKEEIEKYFKV